MSYTGLLNIASDAEDFDTVEVVEVVFEVELIKVEGSDEGGVVGRGEGRAEKCEREVGSVLQEKSVLAERMENEGELKQKG